MNTSGQSGKLLEVATDLTSWYGFLAYLTGDLSTLWARDNYLDVTVLTLIGADIRTPLPPTDKTGPGYELSPLRAYFDRPSDVGPAHEQGLKYVAEWLHEPAKAEALRDFLNALLRDESCDDWLLWHIKHEWPEHILRCEGLVEKNYEKLVSILVPELTVDAIIDVNKQALDRPKWFSEHANNDHRRLFAADVIRRGVYYNFITGQLGRQQVLHQTRRIPTSAADGVDQHRLLLGFEPFLLAEIIRMHTAVANDRTMQVAKWTECVNKACIPLLQTWQLPKQGEFEANQEALNHAADRVTQISRNLGFSTGSREVNEAVELVGAGIGSAIGAGLGLIIDVFLGGGGISTVIGAGYGAMVGQEVGEYTKRRLSELHGDPGRAAKELSSLGPARVGSSLVMHAPSGSEAFRSTQQDPQGSRLDGAS